MDCTKKSNREFSVHSIKVFSTKKKGKKEFEVKINFVVDKKLTIAEIKEVISKVDGF